MLILFLYPIDFYIFPLLLTSNTNKFYTNCNPYVWAWWPIFVNFIFYLVFQFFYFFSHFHYVQLFITVHFSWVLNTVNTVQKRNLHRGEIIFLFLVYCMYTENYTNGRTIGDVSGMLGNALNRLRSGSLNKNSPIELTQMF